MGPGQVRVLLKKPRPDPRPDPYKNPVRKLQKYPNIYIYTYNLALTNPSFLQSSIFSSSSAQFAERSPFPSADTQNAVPPSFLHSPLSSVHAVLSPISAVTPHASRLPLPLPVTPHASRNCSPISAVTPTDCNSLSLSLF